ncbi:kinesin 4 [Actinidia rufa]|uniref:Kinesin 4 n=1 Tax=Actinidia rufa TaxID=165716 RepID=A0A7J0ES25_9ERIC|nr:kinesin 4 [Actinidia rufa]
MTTTEGILPFSVASVVEGVLQQHGKRLSDIDLASRKAEEASLRRYEAARWLRKTVGVVGGKDLPAELSLRKKNLGLVVEAPSDSVIVPDGAALSAYQYFENVRNFLVAVEEMGLPTFEASDLEQGGKSSRIVNCVLALKSYDDWKRGGGNGLWKFGGNLKPITFGKYFVRKNSEPFVSSLRNLTSEKSLDSISSEQSLCGDLGNDLNEMGNSHSLHMLVCELLSDKKPEEIPFIVENMIGKVMEEFEHRLAGQNEQMRTTLRDEDVSDPNKALSKSSFGDIEELKHTLHTAKADLHFLQIKYQEEVNNLGVHLHGLAYAASGYQRVLEENRKLYNHVQDLKGSIRVYCRVRPFLPGQPNSVSTVGHLDEGSISIITPLKYVKDGRKSFTFNKVFGPSATQEEVFSDTQPLIRSVLDGYNVCIFAYGQTGTGKTHTMTGPKELTQKSVGVNYRALSDLFLISEQRKNTISYEVSVQMIEIYNEQIRDLLATDGLNKRYPLDQIRNSGQKGLNVPDANLIPVYSTDDVIYLMNLGQKNRAVGATAMNDRSSRSHSCLTVHVQGRELTSGTNPSRLYASGGQAKTLMFVHISPEPDAAGETISTLKFADRVSTVELGAARVNKDGADVKELKEQGEPGSLHSALSSTEIQSMNSAGTSLSHPSWQSSGDVSGGRRQQMGDVGNVRGATLCQPPKRQSIDIQDLLMNSPPWPPVGSLASKEDVREAAGSGDWVDKVMLNRQAGNRQDCQDNDVNRNRYETATTDDSDDLEAATSDSSETDLLWPINLPKVNSIPNGLGSKTKKPNPKQTKELRIQESNSSTTNTEALQRSHFTHCTRLEGSQFLLMGREK